VQQLALYGFAVLLGCTVGLGMLGVAFAFVTCVEAVFPNLLPNLQQMLGLPVYQPEAALPAHLQHVQQIEHIESTDLTRGNFHKRIQPITGEIIRNIAELAGAELSDVRDLALEFIQSQKSKPRVQPVVQIPVRKKGSRNVFKIYQPARTCTVCLRERVCMTPTGVCSGCALQVQP
jgi:hypothetical protein